MERECLEIYYNAIKELDVDHFNKDARELFWHSFQKKEEPMPAHSLWRYYYNSRAKICTDALQYFQKDLVTMKSGCGFHKSCNDVYINAYWMEMGKCKNRVVIGVVSQNTLRRKLRKCILLTTGSTQNPRGILVC